MSDNKNKNVKYYSSFEDLFTDDDLGIFSDVKAESKKTSGNSMVQNNFETINSYIDENKRRPSRDSDDTNERLLASRLHAYRTKSDLQNEVLELDRYGLLDGFNLDSSTNMPEKELRSLDGEYAPSEDTSITETQVDDVGESSDTREHSDHEAPVTSKSDSVKEESKATATTTNNPPASLDDIFSMDDDLGIFDDVMPDLYKEPKGMAGVFIPKTREEDDVVASRTQCEDFDKFEPIFDVITKHMKNGEYVVPDTVKESAVHVGSVYEIAGMTAYVADKYIAEDRDNKKKRKERVRVIFSNGTESNMLAFSLANIQYAYEDMRQIEITNSDWVNSHFMESFGEDSSISKGEIEDPDGYIYIAQLKERPSTLFHYKDLHKIGLSKRSAASRTKGSINDATFLHQEVEVIAEYALKGVDVYKVESFIHKFLSEARINLEVSTDHNRRHKPKEWFDVPLDEIDRIIDLVISGDIANYKYNPYTKTIEPK